MELIQAINDRRSIRRFKDEAVPEAMVTQLLDAARLAPSGNNYQPWRFVVVKDKLCKEQLRSSITQPFVAQAPVLIIACVDCGVLNIDYQKERLQELFAARAFFAPPNAKFDATEYIKKSGDGPNIDEAYLFINVAIAVDHLVLRAVDLGLGTCWVLGFDRKKVKDILMLEDRYEPFVLLPVGFPAQNPKPRPRLEIQDILIKEI